MAKQIVIFGSFASCDFARRQSARRPDGNIMVPLTEATRGGASPGTIRARFPGTTSTAILVEFHHHAIPTVFRRKIEATRIAASCS